MPLAAAVVPAVIGAGASLYSAGQSKKAANQANQAQLQASREQLAAQQQNFDRIYGINQPFVQGGQGAYEALLQRYGITPTGGDRGTAGTSPANGGDGYTPPAAGPAPAGGPQASTPWSDPGYTAPTSRPGGTGADWQTYLAQNPDVAAQASQAPDPIAFAQQHYEQFGQAENRALPMNPSVAATTDPAGRPLAPPAPNYGRATDVPIPTYTRPADMGAPNLDAYLGDFKEDPGYKFRLTQALDAVNAKSAARGLLRSGGAAKALEDNASGLASQEYNNWFSRGLAKFGAAQGAYQFGQNRIDNNFTTDRGYGTDLALTQQGRSDTLRQNDRAFDTSLWQYGVDRNDRNWFADLGYRTDRYDTTTDNLFRLTGVGLQGAGNISGAGTNFANAQGVISQNNANSAADRAYSRANTNAGLVGNIAGTATNLFANWGGTSGGSGTPTLTGNWARGVW